MASTSFDLGSGVTAINTILAEEANRIGQDIYTRTLHTSPWMDLLKQSAFPDSMGYQLNTLIYDRALPVQSQGGTVVGVNWTDLGTLNADANRTGTSSVSTIEQPLKDSAYDIQGGRGGAGNGTTGADGNSTDNRAFINFAKRIKSYSLKRAVIESPRIALEDLRFAAYRQEQLRAIMDNMTTATRFTWENRYRDEFELVSDNLIVCKATGTGFNTAREATKVEGQDSTASSSLLLPSANISNAVLDKAYFQLVRKGAGSNSYGKENGRPVFALVCSSEASYALQTEAGFRDDVRYNNSKVSDLIAPLGVEKSFRGFYHLVDDLAPRFTIESNLFVRKQPYVISSISAVTDNASYESAPYELAFIIHPEVMESQVPTSFSGSNGLTFPPLNYRGDFKWTNILNEITNPDGSIGFFRGVLASASKPIKTDFGYAILFQRTSTTPAAN
jgi:hypothetical protein